MKCHVNIEGFKKTQTGKRKVWTMDGKETYCCSFVPCFFIWEKKTKHNDYEAYYGYVSCTDVMILKRGEVK